MMPWRSTSLRKPPLCAALLACAISAPSPPASASAGDRAHWDSQAMSGYSATLEQCAASTVPSRRSVTFTAQMAAIAGAQRMGMRIELQERAPGDAPFHTVLAPGLGVWRNSEAGVKIYKYVKQITNLVAPAVYRAVVRFRWFGEKGRVLRRAELRTARCVQPLLRASSTSGPAAAAAG